MCETIIIDLPEETKAALEDATREEGCQQTSLLTWQSKTICSSDDLEVFENGSLLKSRKPIPTKLCLTVSRENPYVDRDVGSALNIARRSGLEYHLAMSIDEIESAVLKLAAADRARLAESLLESLEQLSDEEKLWAEEAIRRDKEWDADPSVGRPAQDVMHDALAKLK